RFRSSRRDDRPVSEVPSLGGQESQDGDSFAGSMEESFLTPRRVLRRKQDRVNSFGRKGKRVTPVERVRRLEEMKDRENLAAYHSKSRSYIKTLQCSQ
ncbi:hypothetical protein PoB_001666000, partial [Plakobranchus ocellatus]